MRVETTGAFADTLLAHRLAGSPLGVADRGLTTRLVYGTLVWQGRLDHHLGTLLRSSLAGLEPAVRAALRLGLYQLLFLERVPVYAAVDSSVRLAQTAGRGAVGLVNAVLRRAAAAGRDGLALPDPGEDPLGRLAVEWSHPRWLVERWAEELSLGELPELLAADNLAGATALRTNTLRTTRDTLVAELAAAGVSARPSAWASDAVVVERNSAALRELAAWRDGHFAFQGEASQLIVPLLGLHSGARVLDVCAAPGGKAGHAAARVGQTGLVVALDRRAAGVRRIRDEAARLGVQLVGVVGDACRPGLHGTFDAVLVDAPCSGLGTLRRHPELRWRRRPEDVPRLAALQRDLLAGVAPLVRPGGVLVYAVCTIAREENANIVTAFAETHPRFAVESVAAAPDPPPASTITSRGFLMTLPHRHGLDGFFAARLRARA